MQFTLHVSYEGISWDVILIKQPSVQTLSEEHTKVLVSQHTRFIYTLCISFWQFQPHFFKQQLFTFMKTTTTKKKRSILYKSDLACNALLLACVSKSDLGRPKI